MEIPKMKIFVYVLTFLGYAWSGYGAGIISNLRDAVLAAEHVFGDVLENVVTVAKKFKIVHEVFDAAIEEDCIFDCPNEDASYVYNQMESIFSNTCKLGGRAVKNKYHIPTSNGCGSLGLEIPANTLPVGEMTACCNDHDICYDTCGSDKEQCDFDFKRCLYKLCEKYGVSAGETIAKGCKAAAKVLFTGTMTLGCKSYIDSQKEACYCAPPKYKPYATGGEYGEL